MYIIAMVFLVLEPVGVPAMFGFILYKNREALNAGDSAEETAISFDAFKKMVKIIKPDSAFSEEALESVYQAIDKDASGAITLEEFVQDSLDNRLDDLVVAQPDELRPAASSKAVTDQQEEERGRVADAGGAEVAPEDGRPRPAGGRAAVGHFLVKILISTLASLVSCI